MAVRFSSSQTTKTVDVVFRIKVGPCAAHHASTRKILFERGSNRALPGSSMIAAHMLTARHEPGQNSKLPTVSVDDVTATVHFGKDAVKLHFADRCHPAYKSIALSCKWLPSLPIL